MAISKGSPGTKYVRMEINVWYQPDDDHIHITAVDDGQFHTTINDNPDSLRYHPNLFGHLRRVLTDQGRWPA